MNKLINIMLIITLNIVVHGQLNAKNYYVLDHNDIRIGLKYTSGKFTTSGELGYDDINKRDLFIPCRHKDLTHDEYKIKFKLLNCSNEQSTWPANLGFTLDMDKGVKLVLTNIEGGCATCIESPYGNEEIIDKEELDFKIDNNIPEKLINNPDLIITIDEFEDFLKDSKSESKYAIKTPDDLKLISMYIHFLGITDIDDERLKGININPVHLERIFPGQTIDIQIPIRQNENQLQEMINFEPSITP
ncbi:hypothetical protein [Marinicellulosiphila megalodicopiae]|uniref:hypothetical protein n=1 Tax=Marinicellulosiphila megalodicopiae TaxID=2724896 RepID=UPI003BAE2BFF